MGQFFTNIKETHTTHHPHELTRIRRRSDPHIGKRSCNSPDVNKIVGSPSMSRSLRPHVVAKKNNCPCGCYEPTSVTTKRSDVWKKEKGGALKSPKVKYVARHGRSSLRFKSKSSADIQIKVPVDEVPSIINIETKSRKRIRGDEDISDQAPLHKVQKTIDSLVQLPSPRIHAQHIVKSPNTASSSPAKKFVENSPHLVKTGDVSESAARYSSSSSLHDSDIKRSLFAEKLASTVSQFPQSSHERPSCESNIKRKNVRSKRSTKNCIKVSIEPKTLDDRVLNHALNNVPVSFGEPELDAYYDWIKDLSHRQIDEFLDLNDGEKRFFQLWNNHIHEFPCYGNLMMIDILHIFIDKYASKIYKLNLHKNFILHLTNLFHYAVISDENLKSLVQMFYEKHIQIETKNEDSKFNQIQQKYHDYDKFTSLQHSILMNKKRARTTSKLLQRNTSTSSTSTKMYSLRGDSRRRSSSVTVNYNTDSNSGGGQDMSNTCKISSRSDATVMKSTLVTFTHKGEEMNLKSCSALTIVETDEMMVDESYISASPSCSSSNSPRSSVCSNESLSSSAVITKSRNSSRHPPSLSSVNPSATVIQPSSSQIASLS